MPFGSPSDRITRLSDTLGLLRETLPDITIMIAASGPKLLTLAAQKADIVAFGWPPATDTDAARERIDIVLSAAGQRAGQLELASGLIAVGDGDAPWLARMGTGARTLADGGDHRADRHARTDGRRTATTPRRTRPVLLHRPGLRRRNIRTSRGRTREPLNRRIGRQSLTRVKGRSRVEDGCELW